MSARRITWAIRYTGQGADVASPDYVTPMELGDLPHRTGYGYCCGCKETLLFDTEIAAKKFCERTGIPLDAHTMIDSNTARLEKAARPAATAPATVKSALTGKAVKA